MKDSSKVKLGWFISWIIFAIVVTVGIYILNREYKLGIDSTMTGYVGLIAAPATAYLWIVREKKKEKELENKSEDQYQVKVSELNKVQIEAVNQFYDEKKYLAGAFSLSGLIDEWMYLSDIYENHKRENFKKTEQIASILFTRHDENERIPHQFKEIESKIIVDLVKLQKEPEQIFEWSKYKFDYLSFGSNVNEFPGLELPYKNDFVNAKLLRATFTHTDFTLLNLNGISSNQSNFYKSGFINTKLNDSEFIDTHFKEALLQNSEFQNAVLHDSDFFMADLSNADLRNADLTDVRFRNADLKNADLRGSILKGTDFTSANLKGARLKGAIIDGAYFNSADITDIDLNGQEFSESEIYDLIINNRVIDSEERLDILSGNLQQYF